MIVAMFRRQDELVQALRQLRDRQIGPLETYTPAPLEGEDTSSVIPVIILLAGLLGGAASFALQTYSFTVAYPFAIGGRPQFAWASFIPTIFENAVLIAIVAGFVAFMVINRMPRLYDPVDEANAMRQASSDGWVLCIRTEDHATLERGWALLNTLRAEHIQEVAP